MRDWKQLLSATRVGADSADSGTPEDARSPFDRDYDRLVFSSAFRRLQDKTQVFPLSRSDYTRTRLTHSLEVSAVGRALGSALGRHLRDQEHVTGVEPDDLGTIVATACLAHDLGNPPFGHSGEGAIQSWAVRRYDPKRMNHQQYTDLTGFEGNAQAFRMLTRTMNRTRIGGVRPTLATLGAMGKYPRPSDAERANLGIAEKKFGFFREDQPTAVGVYKALGCEPVLEDRVFRRHPLAYLTEAADDVCYAVSDLQDAWKLGVVPYDHAAAVLQPLAARDPGFALTDASDNRTRVGRLASSAIHALVTSVVACTRDSTEQLREGLLDKSVVETCGLAREYGVVLSLVRETAYVDERVVQIEYAGFRVLGGLLDMLFDCFVVEASPTKEHEKLFQVIPPDIWVTPEFAAKGVRATTSNIIEHWKSMEFYERSMRICDYVSGMTDTYALSMYQRLSGVQMPS